jgi:hypothetical protein
LPALIAASATVVVLSIIGSSLPVPFVGRFPVVAIVALLAGIVALPERGMAWAAGAEGEALTARAFYQLKARGSVVLEDRRLRGTEYCIHRFAIGPYGLAIVVEVTSAVPLESAAAKAAYEANAIAVVLTDELARRHLTVWPIVCVDDAWRRRLGAPLEGVSIVDSRGLVRLLRNAPRRLSADDVRQLAGVANDRLRPVAAPMPGIYDPIPTAQPDDRAAATVTSPSGLAINEDPTYMPPVRRAHIQAAREARARATDQRMYWSRAGLAQGKAPPTIPPSDPEQR